MGVPLPVLLFGITLTVEILSWVGHSTIASFVHDLVRTTPHAAQQKKTKAEVLKLRAELAATSSQDEFAKWARLRRQLDKELSNLETINGKSNAAKATFTKSVKQAIWLATIVFPFIVSSWHRKSAVYYLPPEWFGPLGWWLSLPSAPAGAISCGVWTFACKRTINIVKDAIVENLLTPATPEKVPIPIPASSEKEKEKPVRDEL